ncbi:Sugar phosphate isomerase/epimerase [Rheinheimera pacifica]|uniref:Sugar phosphate isomerase/epimerase n=1 Tax=Rheinheimera pacifica TaxID=173990 RepID=A0A1H6J9J8_9GAMM|nr:TIM barrel protein [Rheinheimera pacifica]SEH55641.1 Sugar phosphate isomerase/epimerase [Rheinheimera pacifica]
MKFSGINRRHFLRRTFAGAAIAGLASQLPLSWSVLAASPVQPKISLAQWSLHRQLRSGQLKVLDFAVKTRRDFQLGAVEYVNQFFADKAQDQAFLRQLKQRADDSGVSSLLIMVDAEGDLAAVEAKQRQQAVENHYKWVEAAAFLGCHAIRVSIADNAETDALEMQQAAVLGLQQLAAFAAPFGISIIVENHMGHSMDANWLATVLQQAGNVGSLPDFGNFSGDKYQGTQLLLPFAKGISAKSYTFDENGAESSIDYQRMWQLIQSSGYQGYIGIEYEGESADEDAGILATRDLLLAVANYTGR